MEQVIQNIPD